MKTIVLLRNVSFATFLVNFLLFLVAFSAPHWYDGELIAYGGLWRLCVDGPIYVGCDRLAGGDTSSSTKGVQAMMCLALICLLVSLACYVTWMTKSATYVADRGKDTTADLALISWAVGGGFNTLGIMIHGFDFVGHGDMLGWAYGLAAFTAVFSLTVTALFSCFMWSLGKNRSPPAGASHVTAMTPHPQTAQVMTRPVYVIQQQQAGQPNYQSMGVAYQAAPTVYHTNMAAGYSYAQAQAPIPAASQSNVETKLSGAPPTSPNITSAEPRETHVQPRENYTY